MSRSLHPVDSGPKLALLCLEEAIKQLQDGIDRLLAGGAFPSLHALGAGLSWTAALDQYYQEHAERTVGSKAAYFEMRQASEAGRTVGGLVYARNHLAHGLVAAADAASEVYEPTVGQDATGNITIRPARLPGREYGSNRGSWFGLWLVFSPRSRLPSSVSYEYERDLWYDELVAEKLLHLPFEAALRWFQDQRDQEQATTRP